MAKQAINLGTAPAGAGGDDRRSAWTKAISNFNELYDWLAGSAGATNLPVALPVAKGGTGGITPALARSGLQLGTAAVAAIVGQVSQAGGVPTGAIFERGSNANGEYTKYADGTMDCFLYTTVTDQACDTPYGSLFIGTRTWTFPMAFSAPPAVSLNGRIATGASWAGMGGGASNTGVTVRFVDGFSRATGVTTVMAFMAKGRWY